MRVVLGVIVAALAILAYFSLRAFGDHDEAP
jgi:hypothetical protein